MKISTKHKFAFLCSPKCASTSIDNAIDKFCNIKFTGTPELKHMNAKGFEVYIENFHKKVYPNLTIDSFCMFRHPLRWIESWYQYRARKELSNPEHPNHRRYTGNISFETFISAYTSKGERPEFANLPTQLDFIVSSSQEIFIDYIFLTENIQSVSNFIKNKTGETIIIPKKNISERQPLDLSPENRGKLEAHLANDLIVYNYIKENGAFRKTKDLENITQLLKSKQ